MTGQIVHIEHHDVVYTVTEVSSGWSVWEGPREVAWVPAPTVPGMDELIQRVTDEIDRVALALRPGTLVRMGVDGVLGRLIAVNTEALVDFDDGEFGWYPRTKIRAAQAV